MEKAPGSIASKAFLLGKEAYEVTEAVCSHQGCRNRLYDRELTLKMLGDVERKAATAAASAGLTGIEAGGGAGAGGAKRRKRDWFLARAGLR